MIERLEAILAFGLVVAGVALVSVPAAFIVAGVLLVVDLITPARPSRE